MEISEVLKPVADATSSARDSFVGLIGRFIQSRERVEVSEPSQGKDWSYRIVENTFFSAGEYSVDKVTLKAHARLALRAYEEMRNDLLTVQVWKDRLMYVAAMGSAIRQNYDPSLIDMLTINEKHVGEKGKLIPLNEFIEGIKNVSSEAAVIPSADYVFDVLGKTVESRMMSGSLVFPGEETEGEVESGKRAKETFRERLKKSTTFTRQRWVGDMVDELIESKYIPLSDIPSLLREINAAKVRWAKARTH